MKRAVVAALLAAIIALGCGPRNREYGDLGPGIGDCLDCPSQTPHP
jgi:hypothetical protein